MAETTQEERDEIRGWLVESADYIQTETNRTIAACVRDADELQRLRAEVQRLADNLVHEANGCRGTVEAITKREDAQRLRALLGEEQQ